MRKIASGLVWLVGSAAALAGLSVMLALVLVGVLVVLAVVFGMSALSSREPRERDRLAAR